MPAVSRLTANFAGRARSRALASLNSLIFHYAKAPAPRILFRKKNKANAGKVDQ